MDFNDSVDNFGELLHSTDFPQHFDQLELDSLLYGNDDSQESSSSFGFEDQTAGFRSRDGGSLGDSSSDSSPPLSCANFTENDQEMWDFGFQNPSPYGTFDQFGTPYQEEETIGQQFVEEEQIVEKPVAMPPKRIIAILPKQQVQVKKVASRPIQKVYRFKDMPVDQQSQNYRVVQQGNSQQRAPQRQMDRKPFYYTEAIRELESQPQSGPLIRQEDEQQRYVPIAPTVNVKQEVQNYSPEQNRKIRNRMYAQASRIRKKEAEESLKQNLQELMHENEMLRNENTALKQRLAYYENEEPIVEMPQTVVAGRAQTNKKMIAAGTVLMMFGLFAVISPFNVLYLDNNMTVTTQVMAIANESSVIPRHSRVLGNEETTAIIQKPQENFNNFANSSQNDCEMYKLNATETLRVNNDIDRWVQVHSFDNVPIKFSGGLLNKEAMRKFNEARKVQKTANVFGPQKQTTKKSEQAEIRSRERTWRQLDLLKTGNTMAQVDNEKLQRKRQDIDKIASIVRQKGDTLYIITLQDYVLLPSLKKGGNTIPKLSLLLPSVPMNGTMLDQYSLLRVDCEVTGTGQLTLSNKHLSYLMP